ncbi:multidrug MFS transporter [Companilactobacillus suantsaicola]|uniref:Multidrug MFS transporter n=1 Tax=Companilactobacillus suantsaicola TaxID=2487723 RepID=A0A4Z0JIS5_9LACO|nr:glycosyltransferase [Companilactobacillus suantsaicola]TGD22757.1 multidrug MFS transporter [Companilactobacillus suantsaicola]
MIFVTVGTHEQPFDRLIKEIDMLVKNRIIEEKVIIQRGYSNYIPKYCVSEKFLSHRDISKDVSDARIVITHGGPSSFIMPLQMHKIPIVVPRLSKFNEHVNNHQLEFVRLVAERKKNILVVEDIKDLGKIIENYNNEVNHLDKDLNSNNFEFNKRLQELVDGLFR